MSEKESPPDVEKVKKFVFKKSSDGEDISDYEGDFSLVISSSQVVMRVSFNPKRILAIITLILVVVIGGISFIDDFRYILQDLSELLRIQP